MLIRSNYYAMLGVPEDASEVEIQQALEKLEVRSESASRKEQTKSEVKGEEAKESGPNQEVSSRLLNKIHTVLDRALSTFFGASRRPKYDLRLEFQKKMLAGIPQVEARETELSKKVIHSLSENSLSYDEINQLVLDYVLKGDFSNFETDWSVLRFYLEYLNVPSGLYFKKIFPILIYEGHPDGLELINSGNYSATPPLGEKAVQNRPYYAIMTTFFLLNWENYSVATLSSIYTRALELFNHRNNSMGFEALCLHNWVRGAKDEHNVLFETLPFLSDDLLTPYLPQLVRDLNEGSGAAFKTVYPEVLEALSEPEEFLNEKLIMELTAHQATCLLALALRKPLYPYFESLARILAPRIREWPLLWSMGKEQSPAYRVLYLAQKHHPIQALPILLPLLDPQYEFCKDRLSGMDDMELLGLYLDHYKQTPESAEEKKTFLDKAAANRKFADSWMISQGVDHSKYKQDVDSGEKYTDEGLVKEQKHIRHEVRSTALALTMLQLAENNVEFKDTQLALGKKIEANKKTLIVTPPPSPKLGSQVEQAAVEDDDSLVLVESESQAEFLSDASWGLFQEKFKAIKLEREREAEMDKKREEVGKNRYG